MNNPVEININAFKKTLIKPSIGFPNLNPVTIQLAGDAVPEQADEESKLCTEIKIHEIFELYEPRKVSDKYEIEIRTFILHSGDTWMLSDSKVKEVVRILTNKEMHALSIAAFPFQKFETCIGSETIGFESEGDFKEYCEKLRMNEYGQVLCIEEYPVFACVEQGRQLIDLSLRLSRIISKHEGVFSEDMNSFLLEAQKICNNTGGFLENDVHKIFTAEK